MSWRLRALVSTATLAAVSFASSTASADVSAWTHVSGGVMGWKMGEGDELDASGMMSIDAGMGSSPRAPFIFGGYFKIMPVFDHGVDLGLMARFASRGFQTDFIGFAIDAGLHQRFWGTETTGFIGQAVLGLPLGLQLTAFGTGGSNDSFGFGGTLGIDFVQLTVDRLHLLDWWPNPRPADEIQKTGAASSGFRF